MSIRALPYADRQRMYGGEASRQQARACNIVSSDAQQSRIAQRRVWEGRRVRRGREGEAGERRARMDGCTTPTSKSGLHVLGAHGTNERFWRGGPFPRAS